MQASHREDAVAVVRRLRDSGHVAYFAGGCVRDMLLGLDPKDYDVATDAPPPRVRELFPNTQAVGAAFGVILVRHGKSVIEVATFRTDVSYEDGRHPTAVKFTTAEEDAKRRDFTINGLFFDPVEDKVIDYIGGQDDLKSRTLRAIGDPNHRFEEDHLRMLRAIRFAARFQLSIDPNTAAAIKQNVAKIRRISPERVGEEIRIMLTPPTRITAWQMLWEFGFVREIFRFVADVEPRRPDQLLLESLDASQAIPFSLALATMILCYDRGTQPEPMLRGLRQSLRTSNEEHDQASEILRSLQTLLAEPMPGVAKLKRFLARPTSGGSRALLDALAGAGLHQQRIDALKRTLNELEKTDFAATPLVTGDDLTAAGLQPGPVFKRVLDSVYDAQLEDRVKTKDDAMKLAIQLAREEKK